MEDCVDANTIAAYVDGILGADARARVDSHMDRCATCRQEVSALVAVTTQAATPSNELADTLPREPADAGHAPATIGRYQIVRQLGAGGMGVVWEGSDPELDRRVAIKVMHQALGESGGFYQAQLKREAQALAKLEHPNVVAVYDVGLAGGELYVVMQLVDGTTLDRYLAERTRSLREIVALFVQAARGLAAAHAAQIVHRDFKPTNVLVDRNGAVRVSDFGLARAVRDPKRAVPGDVAVTAPAGLVGTPAYMAPEQFEGGEITPATDQFAFCIALWEAIYEQRPFAGDDITTLRDAVVQGRRTEVAGKLAIPRPIRAALVRGLSPDPRDRFPSMEALIAELVPPRRRWIGAAALAVAAAGTAAVAMGAFSHRDPCAGIERPADAVWNPAQRELVTRALGPAGTAAVFAIDDRMTRWRSSRRDACEATHVRGDQPQALLDRRNLCLDRSLTGMRAAIAILANQPDTQTKTRARDIARSALDPDDCNAANVATSAPEIHDAAHEAMFAKIAELHAERIAGQYAKAYGERAALEAELGKLDSPELSARGFRELALVADHVTDNATVTDLLQRAAEAATRAGLDSMAVSDWCDLAVHVMQTDISGARRLLAVARGLAMRTRSPHDEIEVESAFGEIAYAAGDYTTAVAQHQKATAIAERLGDRAILSDELTRLAEAQDGGGDVAAAVATWQRAIDLLERDRGADNPDVLFELHFLAGDLDERGDHAAAAPLWNRALAGLRRSSGDDSAPVMRVMADRARSGMLYRALPPEETLAMIERASALGDKLLPPKDPDRGLMLEVLAGAQRAVHHDADATATLRRAVAFYESADAPLSLARVLYALGEHLSDLDHCAEAIPMFQRAAKTAAQTGLQAKLEAISESSEGACVGSLGHHAEAVAKMTHAIERLQQVGNVEDVAHEQWQLATEYFQSGQKQRGLDLARTAAASLDGRPSAAQLRTEILAWIEAPE